MSRKGETLNLSVSSAAKQGLEQLALEFGKTWGGKSNISALVEAIGAGEIPLMQGSDQALRIQALMATPEVRELIKLLKLEG